VLQQHFLERQARAYARDARRDIIRRCVKAALYGLISFVNGFGFSLFAWTAANIEAPVNDPNFPLPEATFTYSMAAVAVICLVLCIVFLFYALDEILPTGDSRRITKSRS
jgi:uncharacterized membrane protein